MKKSPLPFIIALPVILVGMTTPLWIDIIQPMSGGVISLGALAIFYCLFNIIYVCSPGYTGAVPAHKTDIIMQAKNDLFALLAREVFERGLFSNTEKLILDLSSETRIVDDKTQIAVFSDTIFEDCLKAITIQNNLTRHESNILKAYLKTAKHYLPPLSAHDRMMILTRRQAKTPAL